MIRSLRISMICPLVLLCLAIAACTNNPQPSGQAQNPSATPGNHLPEILGTSDPNTPNQDDPEAPTAYRGPGAQDLADPATGLEALTAYQAVLTISFDGSQDGQPTAWSETRSLVVDTAGPTRLLSIESDGLPEDSSLNGWLLGTYQGLLIQRRGVDIPCGAVVDQGSQLPPEMEPARQLLPVYGAEEVGSAETVQGVSAKHYSFGPSAVGMPDGGQATGNLYLAEQGGYVVQYSLRLEGNADFFGQEMEGVMTWEYTLENVDPAQAVLPADCPPGLVDISPMDGATAVDSRPGLQEYTLTVEPSALVDYYTSQLTSAGYQPVGEPAVSDRTARLVYTRQGLTLTLSAQANADGSLHVMILLENGQADSETMLEPEPEASPPPSAEADIANALMLTLGSGDTPGVLPSYHMDVNGTRPASQGTGQVATEAYQVQADVQGQDFHLITTKTEGYVVGGKEYQMINGQLQDSLGTIQLEWAMWPLDVIMPLSIAALGPTPQGSDTVDGRPANVYALDSANADPTTLATLQGMFSMMASTVTAARGQVWLDQQTGALLKASLAYEVEIKDLASGKVIGSGAGQVELTVTQVGAVTVQLP